MPRWQRSGSTQSRFSFQGLWAPSPDPFRVARNDPRTIFVAFARGGKPGGFSAGEGRRNIRPAPTSHKHKGSDREGRHDTINGRSSGFGASQVRPSHSQPANSGPANKRCGPAKHAPYGGASAVDLDVRSREHPHHASLFSPGSKPGAPMTGSEYTLAHECQRGKFPSGLA